MSNEVTQQVLYFGCADSMYRQSNADKLNEWIANGWTVDQLVLGHHQNASYMYAVISKKEQKPSAGIQ